MKKLQTTYAGLTLKNPLIVGSSSLTGSIANLKKFEDLGASAVVLKSIFEEEITNEFHKILNEADAAGEVNQYLDYFDAKIKNDNISDYLSLIKEAKKTLDIPVIASVNCVTSHEWRYFVKQIEKAKADAIELNIFYFPADFNQSGEAMERKYLTTIQETVQAAHIPVVVKISPYFTNLGAMIQKVSQTGVAGITLFNRFSKPDIDLTNGELHIASVFSNPQDYLVPLQWTALMYDKIDIPMAASTGIHTPEAFVKLLLSGANANYIVSALFKKGFDVIPEMLNYLEAYLQKNNYRSLQEIIGKLSQKNVKNPGYYERAQFMRYFTGATDIL